METEPPKEWCEILLSKAHACIEMSEQLLLEGDHAASLECAIVAAKYLQLIRLFRSNLDIRNVAH